MKLLLLAAVVGLIVMGPVTPKKAICSDKVAVAGCCKQREGRRWVSIPKTFEACLRLNAVNDQDNIHDPNGLYWWDIKC